MNTNKKLDNVGLERLVTNINNNVNAKVNSVKGEIAPIPEEQIRSLFTGEGDTTDPVPPNPPAVTDAYTKAESDAKYSTKTESDNKYVNKTEIADSMFIKHTTINDVKTFNSTKNGYMDNIVVEGKTLVNVIEKLYRINGSDSDKIIRTRFNPVDDTYIKNTRISNGTWTFYNMTDKKIRFVAISTSNSWVVNAVDYVEPNSHKTVTLDGSYAIVGVDFQPDDGWSNSDLSIYKETMLMVVEGIQGDLPYFKGISSVGQNSGVKLLNQYRGINIIPNNITTEKNKCIQFNDGKIVDMNGYYLTDYIEIKPNTHYVFADINKNVAYYDSNKTFIPMPLSDGIAKLDYTYFYNTSPSNAKYIRLSIKDMYKTTPCMFEGDYLYDEQKINQIFRSLPNGTKDLIIKCGTKYYKYQKCGIHTIDGTETDITPGVAGDYTRLRVIVPKDFKNNRDNMYCNILNVKNSTNFASGEFIVGEIQPDVGKYVYINILRSRIPVFELANIKQWLADNLPTIVYELETPQLIELPNFNPRVFKGNNTIIVDGLLHTNATFEITNNLRGEINVLKDKVDSVFQSGSSTKQNLADKLTSVGVPNVSASNTFAELIASIPMKGADVKIATGEIVVDQIRTKKFVTIAGGILSRHYIELNLGFKPDNVIVMPKIGSTYSASFVHDTPFRYQTGGSSQELGKPWVFVSSNTSDTSSRSDITYLRADNLVYIDDNIIHVPMSSAPASAVFYYTAIKYK